MTITMQQIRLHAGEGELTPDEVLKAANAVLAGRGTISPDWEGFGRAITERWPVYDLEGSDLFELCRDYRLVVEVPGGYDPEHHFDEHGICPEKGDPWFEYNFPEPPEVE